MRPIAGNLMLPPTWGHIQLENGPAAVLAEGRHNE
jgi:hypothetical protein